MAITTDDCKNYLIQHFKDTLKNDWKRDTKYKNQANEVCREFSHPSKGTQGLVEKSGGLEIFDIEQKSNNVCGNLHFTQKVFPGSDVAGAKKLLTDYKKLYNKSRKTQKESDEEAVDLFTDTSEFKKNEHALTNLMRFFYDDNSFSDNKPAKLDDIVSNFGDILDAPTIWISDIVLNYPDLGTDGWVSDVLKSNNFIRSSECAYCFDDKNSNKTFKDVIQLLMSLGFVYDKSECYFKDQMKSATFNPSLKSLPGISSRTDSFY